MVDTSQHSCRGGMDTSRLDTSNEHQHPPGPPGPPPHHHRDRGEPPPPHHPQHHRGGSASSSLDPHHPHSFMTLKINSYLRAYLFSSPPSLIGDDRQCRYELTLKVLIFQRATTRINIMQRITQRLLEVVE